MQGTAEQRISTLPEVEKIRLPISQWAFFGVNWLSSYSNNVTLKDIDFFAKQQAVVKTVFKKRSSKKISALLSGQGGSDVCLADLAGSSERSSFVGRKCPWLTLRGGGSFVEAHCESKHNQRLRSKWRTLLELVAPPTPHLDKHRLTFSFIKTKNKNRLLHFKSYMSSFGPLQPSLCQLVFMCVTPSGGL